MSNGMIERVARAMYDYATGSDVGWPMTNPTPWRKAARAAIEAMREPTDAMVTQCTDTGHTRDDARAVWQRMVDEALKP